MSGAYYVFGDIKGGKSFKFKLSALLKRVTRSSPSVLYLGAAHLNQPRLKASFETGLRDVCPDARMESLNLSGNMSHFDNDAQPMRIDKRFSEADVIFFDGGGVKPLRDVFERFQLTESCQWAYERGAFVGGLCAGGSLLGEWIVANENGKTTTQSGMGLVQRTAISCHMDLPEQYDQRLSLLTETVSRRGASRAVGISNNEAVLFEGDHICALSGGGESDAWPFTVDAASKISPIPYC
jgi:hypothetical protein